MLKQYLWYPKISFSGFGISFEGLYCASICPIEYKNSVAWRLKCGKNKTWPSEGFGECITCPHIQKYNADDLTVERKLRVSKQWGKPPNGRYLPILRVECKQKMFLGQMTKTALFSEEKMIKGTLSAVYRDFLNPHFDIGCKARNKVNPTTGKIEKDFQWSFNNKVLTPGKGSKMSSNML